MSNRLISVYGVKINHIITKRKDVTCNVFVVSARNIIKTLKYFIWQFTLYVSQGVISRKAIKILLRGYLCR